MSKKDGAELVVLVVVLGGYRPRPREAWQQHLLLLVVRLSVRFRMMSPVIAWRARAYAYCADICNLVL